MKSSLLWGWQYSDATFPSFNRLRPDWYGILPVVLCSSSETLHDIGVGRSRRPDNPRAVSPLRPAVVAITNMREFLENPTFRVGPQLLVPTQLEQRSKQAKL